VCLRVWVRTKEFSKIHSVFFVPDHLTFLILFFFHLHFGWPNNDYFRGTFKLRIYLTRSPKFFACLVFVEIERKYLTRFTSWALCYYRMDLEYKLSDMSEFQSDIRVSADVTGNRSTYRSVAVSSSAETALTIDTENFTADVTRKRKHNFHIGLSN